jgi:hypothetical protein
MSIFKSYLLGLIFLIVIFCVWKMARSDSSAVSPSLPEAGSRRQGAAPPSRGTHPEISKREEQFRLVNSDNAPIEFYGMVQDESGKGLAGVEVKWSVLKSGSLCAEQARRFLSGERPDVSKPSQ